MDFPSGILNKLLDLMPSKPVPVREVVVGVHWTLVTSQQGGLASTLVGDGPHGHSRVRDVGELHQKSAQELAQWVLSENLLEASIGMAAMNSLIEIDDRSLETINASEVIAREGYGKDLAVVGHFPFVEQVKTITRNCWVIEKRPHGDDFPPAAAREFLPRADIIAITGTALINHTMEFLLSLCRPDALVMILGPSTPLTPLLFDFGISFLSGSCIGDEGKAIRTIQQGAIFPQVGGVRLVTMTRSARVA